MKLFFSRSSDQPRLLLLLLGMCVVNELSVTTSNAQGPQGSLGGIVRPSVDGRPSPASQFKPLGQTSAVDRFAPRENIQRAQRSGSDLSGVRQTAYMQSGFSMPALGDNAVPPTGTSSLDQPALQPLTAGPTPPSLTNPAPGLNPVPRTNNIPLGGNTAAPTGTGFPNSPSDLTPIPSPQLNPNWSTVDNCALVSPPSGYRAQFWGCGPVVPAGAIPYDSPQIIAPATVMPGSPAAGSLYAGSVGPKPLFTLGQERNNVSLGQGIIGQPVAYVPGQYFRNFLRYLSP